MEIYRQSRTRSMDLVHTKLHVSFDWSKQHLNGKAILDVTPYFFPQQELVLDAKGMVIHGVNLSNVPENQTLKYIYDDDQLIIHLDKEYSRGDTIQVSIDYTAKPNERALGGSDAIKADKGLYFINPLGEEPNKPMQIWTQGETEASSVWFPTIDSPNERCTQEMYITVKDQYTTLSNGLLKSSQKNDDGTRTDYWLMDLPHAPYLFMMTVGEFDLIEDQWEDIPLAYMVEKEFAPYAKAIFGNTPEMMTFFSDLLGIKYPWQKYTQVVVRDYVSGAMENTSASLFGEFMNMNLREHMDERREDIIAHELFHQWFGDFVTTESWSNLTLNEGFADYSEYLWNEYKYGQDEADYKFSISKDGYFAEAESEPKPLIRYFYEDKEDMFDRHSYNKGGWVLHMLRNYLGDEAFFSSLNLYLQRNAYQSVEIHDLRLAFEDVTGEDLNWFFDQWYLMPGHPVLEVSQNYSSDTLSINVVQAQEEDIHLYRLPLFVDIWTDGKLDRYPLIIEEQNETYKFPLTKAPDLVILDGEQQLLAEIRHKKSDLEYLKQFELGGRYSLRYEAIERLDEFEDKNILDELLKKGLKDPHFDIRMAALNHIADEIVKPKKYVEELKLMLSDESSYVRAEALSILMTINKKNHLPSLQAALKDSSYYVIGNAIQILADAKEQMSPAQIEVFKQETNVNVVVALCAYFSEMEQFPPYQWYVDKLNVLSGNPLYYYIQYFSEMLLKASNEDRSAAVPLLEKIASDHSNYVVRLSAYQGLILLSDLPGVEQKLAAIKDAERDKRLINIYKKL